MARPWEAEQTVDGPRATRLIEAQFPSLGPVRVEPFGVGWDNTAYLVNGDYVFRFPRRQMAVPFLENECRVLPLITGRVPLPVPKPEFIGVASPDFGWPFSGYRLLAGRTADRAKLDDRQRTETAKPLARFLRTLHGLDVDAGPDTINRLDAASRAPKIRTMLADLNEPAARFEAVIEDAAGTSPRGRGTLVHGDLYSRHLLVDDVGVLGGVIDWGDVHCGDVAVDLSVAWSVLPRSAHDAFRAEYGEIDDPTWRLARFKALLTAVSIALYGCETGDLDLEREGRWTMESVATPPSRRSPP